MQSSHVAASREGPILLRLVHRTLEQLHRREHAHLPVVGAIARRLLAHSLQRLLVKRCEALVQLEALDEALGCQVAESRRCGRLLRAVQHVQRPPVLLCVHIRLHKPVHIVGLVV